MACSYNAFAGFETHVIGLKETWKTLKQGDDWYFYYAQAQIWAFSTMCNTTSQTISTTQEYLFTSLWMLISSIAFAYLINKIGSILSDLNQQEESYRDDINVLNQFMKRKQINLGLQRMLNLELKQYYKQEELKKKIDVQGTLSKLSKPMYKELMQESYKKVLNQLPYFQNYVSENNLSKVYEIMEEIGYSQHQVIESNDFEDDVSIYFVLKGQFILKQCLNYDENQCNKTEEEQQIQEKPLKNKIPSKNVYKDIKYIKKGQFFGMFEFLTGQKRLYIAESQNVSIVIRLPLNKFLDIIKSDEKDYQKYMEFRDKLIFNQNISFFNIPCYTCGQVDHFFINCSKTHFTRDNPFLIPKHNFSFTQDRNPNYERKSRGQYKMIFQEVEEEEDDCISQKSSSYTGQKNDRSHEDQYSYFDIEKEQMERPELRGNRGSTYYLSVNQQKRHSIEEKINEDPIIIISQANDPYIQKAVSQKTMNGQSQDQDQQGYLRQSKNSEYLDEQTIENLKNSTKMRRASSNKFLNSSLSRRFSTSNNNKIKRYSVDDMTPKIAKNVNLNQIEEIGESLKEIDYSFSEMNKQNSFNSNRNSLTIFGVPKQRKSSFNLQTYSQFTNLKPYQLDSQFRRMQIEWKDSLDYWKFDKLTFLKYYFSDYNYLLVIRRIQKYKAKKNIKLKTEKIIQQQNSQFKKLNTLLKKKTTNTRSLQHLQTKLAKNE
ncbi:kinase domain protein (macronuclear) [Tetrahymena thermophila SB210]|uniref:Kinase domain protein n=1 Tax=Tetrahymena thermophila (strain SB210) TaxID=312017 RepID=W7X4L6_TETTS|nr:kinase domain protein [Tetrahymena thermophila SB210]EWS72342.1 kinase domain protein [Tetrahymena thermophila SB210]|eukprot:XP_012655119.1 kinase domain protein [Tetrahymena thermophila SB210]